MADLFDLVQKIAGRPDPMDQLAALAAAGTPATPQAAVPTSDAASATPGGAAPAAPAQQPAAYQTQPDLVQLYTELMKRENNRAQFNSGASLIAASMAQDQNRGAILASQMGRDRQDPANLINNVLSLTAQTTALQQKAAQRASLPAIAKQYGLDLATVQYLFDAGKLDEVIAEAEKPNKEIVQDENGQHYIVDKTDGSMSAPFGNPKKREIELVDDGNGGKLAVYKDTKEPVGKNDIPGTGATGDQQDYNFYVKQETEAGRTPDSFEVWRLRSKKAGATNIDLEGGTLEKELSKSGAKRLNTDLDAARAASDTIEYARTARSKLEQGMINGSILSPVELEGRKIWAQIIGIPDKEIATTESFKSSLKEVVLSKIKALGSGTAISDTDRRFIEQATGGDITLTTDSMRQIFDILEKYAYRTVDRYNKEVEDLINSYESDEDRKRIGRLIPTVERPPMPELGAGSGATLDDLLKKYGD